MALVKTPHCILWNLTYPIIIIIGAAIFRVVPPKSNNFWICSINNNAMLHNRMLRHTHKDPNINKHHLSNNMSLAIKTHHNNQTISIHIKWHIKHDTISLLCHLMIRFWLISNGKKWRHLSKPYKIETLREFLNLMSFVPTRSISRYSSIYQTFWNVEIW